MLRSVEDVDDAGRTVLPHLEERVASVGRAHGLIATEAVRRRFVEHRAALGVESDEDEQVPLRALARAVELVLAEAHPEHERDAGTSEQLGHCQGAEPDGEGANAKNGPRMPR